MYMIMIKIAEHMVEIKTDSKPILQWIQRHFKQVNSHNAIDLSINIKDGFGSSFTNYDVEILSESEFITYTRTDYKIKVDKMFQKADISVYNNFALKHAFTNLYSAFIIHHGWGLLFHSSCAIQKHRAYIFTGQSGAGKSTVAQLSTPRILLSDEAAIVNVSESEVKIYDSPFRSEILSTYELDYCEPAGIYVLNQSLEVQKKLIKKSDAAFVIMDKIFHWHHDSMETNKLLSMCKQLIEHVPIYQLYFQKNNTFWELIS
ncbi:MAG: hypothetical protein ACO1OT_05845 [Heyndrickxia sp.]